MAVELHVQRASNYTCVYRVSSTEENPVSCFDGVPLSWPDEISYTST